MTVAVVVVTYLAGKLAYRMRDVLLMIAVAGFVSLILNPLVVFVQRRGPAPRLGRGHRDHLGGPGLRRPAAAFGYPLANGVTHLAQRLPSYVQAAEHGRGWIGHLVAAST